MKLIFLDDSPFRREWARQSCKPNIITLTSVNEMIDYLSKEILTSEDVISLDNDLGEYEKLGGEGKEVVNWLVKNTTPTFQYGHIHIDRATKIIIHSWNIIAAGEMYSKLLGANFTNVTREPFDLRVYTELGKRWNS